MITRSCKGRIAIFKSPENSNIGSVKLNIQAHPNAFLVLDFQALEL
jgi:tRNA(Phe) wybutosine-synthesizing methylase Tyw3